MTDTPPPVTTEPAVNDQLEKLQQMAFKDVITLAILGQIRDQQMDTAISLLTSLGRDIIRRDAAGFHMPPQELLGMLSAVVVAMGVPLGEFESAIH